MSVDYWIVVSEHLKTFRKNVENDSWWIFGMIGIFCIIVIFLYFLSDIFSLEKKNMNESSFHHL